MYKYLINIISDIMHGYLLLKNFDVLLLEHRQSNFLLPEDVIVAHLLGLKIKKTAQYFCICSLG